MPLNSGSHLPRNAGRVRGVDGRSDIYALGIVGYFALTGRLPFDAPTVQATLAMQLTQEPPPLAGLRAELPNRLVDIINRCLAKAPAARFASAEELAEALGDVATPGAEPAPILRNWLRVAEQWQIVAWILGPISVVFIVMAPQLTPVVVVLFLAGLSWLTVDLVTRTRLLLRQGFTHDDVRAAIWIEREARQRELRSVLGNAQEAARRRRSLWRWLGVSAAGLVSALLVGIVRRRTPDPPVLLVAIKFGGAIAFVLGLMVSLTASPYFQRSNTLYYTAVWRRWFGRWFFSIVGRGLHPVRLRKRDMSTLGR